MPPRQAGAMAAASCQFGFYLGRFVVVVDEDMTRRTCSTCSGRCCTRCDPAEDIDIIARWGAGPGPAHSRGRPGTRAPVIEPAGPSRC